MASVTLNFNGLNKTVNEIIATLSDKDALFKPVAIELLGLMHKRIHDDGLASDGSLIGHYKSNYLKLREKRGLGGDPNVILVLTRKLSNSWAVFATEHGYAVGFIDSGASGGSATSREKIMYAEMRFGKKIFDMTDGEQKYAAQRTIEIVAQKLEKYATA